MTLLGRPILSYHAPASGIRIGSDTYEYLEAARDYGYVPFEAGAWSNLSTEQQAILIAHRRIRLHAEAVLAYRQAQKNTNGLAP